MDYLDDIKMRVSIDTVYRWVYRDAGLGGQLFSCLCLCRSHRNAADSAAMAQGAV
ncbi:MAG: hypothetical protein Q8L71_03110 [Thiobacillus sp.]|nr:hypothetical protein [Thiobacillus sp.]